MWVVPALAAEVGEMVYRLVSVNGLGKVAKTP
jgi:hypothetical protein